MILDKMLFFLVEILIYTAVTVTEGPYLKQERRGSQRQKLYDHVQRGSG